MKNNKILKPIIAIGFATKGESSGKIRINIDRNKLNGLNAENLNELKRQISFTLNSIPHTDTILSSRQYDEVIGFLKQDKVLAAIKAYKDFTGVGLKEAKKFVDTLRNSEI